MLMKQLCLSVFLICACMPRIGFAQQAKADMYREANFLFEVKIIDEFIERFNDDPTSNLRQEYARANRKVPFTRKELVRSLFERPVKPGDAATEAFIRQVIDSSGPQLLLFNDSNWYAEVIGIFTMNNKRVEIPLILRIDKGADQSVKWLIAGIGGAGLFMNEPATPEEEKVKKSSIKTFISPSSHATAFLELRRILLPGINAEHYFTPELLSSDKAKKFVQLVSCSKLHFEYTGTMRFYFFQIPNYIFTVERFERATTHSGWLISNLEPASQEEKKQRVDKLLQRAL